MEHYLFPKMLGMVERSWNSDTTYTRPEFNQIIDSRELPYLAKRGVNFHLRQPGVIVRDGKILMNSPYKDAVIRYTLDGSDPDAQSPVYTGPIALPDNVREVRARMYQYGKESVSSILPVKR